MKQTPWNPASRIASVKYLPDCKSSEGESLTRTAEEFEEFEIDGSIFDVSFSEGSDKILWTEWVSDYTSYDETENSEEKQGGRRSSHF